ncbi:hypothetical protein FE257_007758 [Aspergillus nanangensis]|uniref:Uncharacterized protein n=1 Tax=Aspergillus nanangensis TaxID=2582783 RepID=A0AAD4CWY6_ASPNN|nr:hypothetical protein FE257_007758 [Aspergillus nanangensis]
MSTRLTQVLAVLSMGAIHATAVGVVTILGAQVGDTAVGREIGTSGSLTSYVIDCPTTISAYASCGVPQTVLAGPSAYHVVYTYPGGDIQSVGCSAVGPSSLACEVYQSDAGSGSIYLSRQLTSTSVSYLELHFSGIDYGIANGWNG